MWLLSLLFVAWIFCVMWALVRSDYKQFKEDEQGKDDYNDPETWGT